MKQRSLRTLLRRAAARTLSIVLALPMTARAAAPVPLLTSTQTYLDGLSYREIADKLGKSAKSIDNAVQRIRQKLARNPNLGEISLS